MRSDAKVVIAVRRESGTTVISAVGAVDISLLADLANAARVVSEDGPVVLDLVRVDVLDPLGAALLAKWSRDGIAGQTVTVMVAEYILDATGPAPILPLVGVGRDGVGKDGARRVSAGLPQRIVEGNQPIESADGEHLAGV